VDTLIHEGGTAQVEINFNHSEPLAIADQAFLFRAHGAPGRPAPWCLCDVHGQAL
jgi:hypothetical protein